MARCRDDSTAEFIISVADEHGDSESFFTALADVGLERTLTNNLLSIIQRMKPKKRKADAMSSAKSSSSSSATAATSGSGGGGGGGGDSKSELARQFPGLAVPNTKPVSFDEDAFLGLGADAEDDVAFLASKHSDRSSRSAATGGSGGGGGAGSSRRGDNDDDDMPDFSYNERAKVDDAPVLYKIYRGRVKSISEAGAFILLEGIAGGVEGQLVRSEIPMNVHLRRDAVVFVKVIAVTKMTIRLNMKDADQRTGKDLNPKSARIGAAAARMLDVNQLLFACLLSPKNTH